MSTADATILISFALGAATWLTVPPASVQMIAVRFGAEEAAEMSTLCSFRFLFCYFRHMEAEMLRPPRPREIPVVNYAEQATYEPLNPANRHFP
ncbi:hypothetical protein F5Y10DRAFT_64694 [Nemania abortiva]|nr:hypothetical protein F5Y10DRAFT_64694 [Nemania abortiva]